jgi:hypothetical protein
MIYTGCFDVKYHDISAVQFISVKTINRPVFVMEIIRIVMMHCSYVLIHQLHELMVMLMLLLM